MDWIPHAVIALLALISTVKCQVVELAKCYKCASAPTSEGRRYLEQVKEGYTRLGYTEFDDLLADCGDPFTRAAGINLRTCDNGYGCMKTRMELRNKQVVILRGCAKYSVCNGRGVNNAPVPIGEVQVDNYCCQDAYCNSSVTRKYNVIILLLSLGLSIIVKYVRLW